MQAELAAAEQEWQEWVIARRRVGTVLALDGDTAAVEITPDPQGADAQAVPRDAAKPKSQVPMWREGLAWSVLSARTISAFSRCSWTGLGCLKDR
nr:hypothetical protein [Streptomyces lasalocidi]